MKSVVKFERFSLKFMFGRVLFFFLLTNSFVFFGRIDTKKIVGLMNIKNQPEVVEQALRCLSLYTDGIVVINDGAFEKSTDFVRNHAKEFNVEKIIFNDNSIRFSPHQDNCQSLLNAGRSIGGTHFILINSDQIISSFCLKDDWLKRKILSLEQHQAIDLPVVYACNGIDYYQCDKSCGGKVSAPLIFCDDESCSYNFISCERNEKSSREVFSEIVINDNDFCVIDFTNVNFDNAEIDEACSICREHLAAGQNKSNVLNDICSFNEMTLQLEPNYEKWFQLYSSFDVMRYVQFDDCKKDNLIKLINFYGIENFLPLDIWNIDFLRSVLQGYKSKYLNPSFLQEQYQDIVINNITIRQGVRDCKNRYKALKPILDLYKRPISVLDLGASQGYFSFKIASEYDAVCVMVENGYNNTWKTNQQLFELCRLNTELDNIIFCQKRITVEELEQLARCEHFDVVLAFNIIHHFGSKWKRVADAVLSLGDNIIIETPSIDDKLLGRSERVRGLNKYLVSHNGIIICEVPRHTNPSSKGKMYWVEQTKNKELCSGQFIVSSNYVEKTLSNEIRPNVEFYCGPGINFATFTMLNGVYPEKDKLEEIINKELCYCQEKLSSDVIVKGNKVALQPRARPEGVVPRHL